MSDTSGVTIVTNNVPRDILDAWELTPGERAQFDYLPWDEIEEGRDSASFFRYRGELFDFGEFTAQCGLSRESRLPAPFDSWDGYSSDSFFSGMVVRYPRESFGRYGDEIDSERIVVGRWFA
jgi:hypothetical protein